MEEATQETFLFDLRRGRVAVVAGQAAEMGGAPGEQDASVSFRLKEDYQDEDNARDNKSDPFGPGRWRNGIS